jgi:EAL domain-containing protein (putative c-di-GMP-specific phosphodiesterase class I)/CheY-like chemotaxis protein
MNGNELIIVIEDDVAIRDMLMRTLSASFNVRACDGRDLSAVAPFDQGRYLLIIDLALGDTDAIEILEGQARAGAFCDVILISGQSLDMLQRASSIADTLGHTVLGALAKPFRRKELLNLLAQRGIAQRSPVEAGQARGGEAVFRRAVEAGRLEFWFQPQIDLRSGRVAGLEALARIRDSEQGLLTPGSFIDALDPAQKLALTLAAVEAAGDLGNRIRGRDITIAVNVFGSLLANEALMRSLIRARNDLAQDVQLMIEVTETEVGDNLVAEAFSTRARLHGLEVSIDDFGTAYSTFNRLRNFCFTQIKLERGMINELTTDQRAQSICRASVELAHACNAQAVAEGVETLEELTRVCALKFDTAQGFLLARPMPLEEVASYLDNPDKQSELRELVHSALDAHAQPIPGTLHDEGTLGTVGATSAVGTRAEYHILLVEDDPLVADMICSQWHGSAVRFSRATNLRQALNLLRRQEAPKLDAVILDLHLPDGSGLDILPNIRDLTDAAVLVISGTGTSESRADIIDNGIDDYVMKPFSVRELKARVLRCLSRRRAVRPDDLLPISHAVSLDLREGVVVSDAQRAALTHAEVLLLRALKDAEGHVATRQSLSRAVLWRDYSKQDKSLDVCVSKLRRKIAGIDLRKTINITTIRGFGYKISVNY